MRGKIRLEARRERIMAQLNIYDKNLLIISKENLYNNAAAVARILLSLISERARDSFVKKKLSLVLYNVDFK
jgi:hypothetical protein